MTKIWNRGHESRFTKHEDPTDDEGNKAEQMKEELGDSGLEISAQEGFDNSDDSKKKGAEEVAMQGCEEVGEYIKHVF